MNVTLSIEITPLTESEVAEDVGQIAETMIAANLIWLKKNPHTPELYKSGVKYKADSDLWGDIPTTIQSGFGDAQELVCWRIAELRAKGIPAKVYILVLKDGPIGTVHLQVALPNGDKEDPAHKLGMTSIPF